MHFFSCSYKIHKKKLIIYLLFRIKTESTTSLVCPVDFYPHNGICVGKTFLSHIYNLDQSVIKQS